MAFSDIIQDLWPAITTQQGQTVLNAFIATQGPVPEGMTDFEFGELCLRRFINAVVKGSKRKDHEITLAQEQSQVDKDLKKD